MNKFILTLLGLCLISHLGYSQVVVSQDTTALTFTDATHGKEILDITNSVSDANLRVDSYNRLQPIYNFEDAGRRVFGFLIPEASRTATAYTVQMDFSGFENLAISVHQVGSGSITSVSPTSDVGANIVPTTWLKDIAVLGTPYPKDILHPITLVPWGNPIQLFENTQTAQTTLKTNITNVGLYFIKADVSKALSRFTIQSSAVVNGSTTAIYIGGTKARIR